VEGGPIVASGIVEIGGGSSTGATKMSSSVGADGNSTGILSAFLSSCSFGGAAKGSITSVASRHLRSIFPQWALRHPGPRWWT
jgi:hypothetical protein